MTVMLATFMEVLDTSVANVSLPHIAGSLSASMDESTWVLTSYLVANAIILPMGGWFSMLLGRKRFYMICVALFTVSSLPVRHGAHAGTADFVPRAPGHRRRSSAAHLAGHPGGKLSRARSRAWRWRSTAWAWWWPPSSAPHWAAGSPTTYSWRWIFFINLPVGILSLVLTSLADFRPAIPQCARASATASRSTMWASACWRWGWARSKWCWTRARAKTGSPPTSS